MEAAKPVLNRDPSEIIANSPMSALQIVVVAITIAFGIEAMNAGDSSDHSDCFALSTSPFTSRASSGFGSHGAFPCPVARGTPRATTCE